jgi:hypothetical protein
VRDVDLARWDICMSEEFIVNTANDYDMDKHDVQRFYDAYGNSNEFYEHLEKFIEDRRNYDY